MKKNLLVITSAFPNNINEYEGIFVKNLVIHLKNYFNKIHVIRPQYYIPPHLDVFNILPQSWKEKPIRESYNIEDIRVFFPKVSIIWLLRNLHLRNFIRKNNIKFDIIHSHFIYPSWEIGNYLKKVFSKPHIITWHWFDVYDLPFRNNLWQRKIKTILSYADGITTVSRSNAILLNKLWFNDVKIIPNWYDEKVFFPYPRHQIQQIKKQLWIQNKKVILNVWNLVPVKNQKTLILACKELLKYRKDFICYIIGEGPLRNELQKLIEENNLQDYIKLLWRKKPEEVAKYMNIADLLVLPSIKEWNPTVLFEALGVGIPVIGSITAWWLPEIITSSQLGYIIKDPVDFKEIALAIYNSLNKQRDKEIIKKVAKQFARSQIAHKYKELLV